MLSVFDISSYFGRPVYNCADSCLILMHIAAIMTFETFVAHPKQTNCSKNYSRSNAKIVFASPLTPPAYVPSYGSIVLPLYLIND